MTAVYISSKVVYVGLSGGILGVISSKDDGRGEAKLKVLAEISDDDRCDLMAIG